MGESSLLRTTALHPEKETELAQYYLVRKGSADTLIPTTVKTSYSNCQVNWKES